MPQQTFTVSENVKIQIRNCHDRVTVVGWDDAHNVALDFPARQEGDTIFVENAGKVTVRVPRAATITITDCQADIRVDDLTGRVELADIGGDVALRNLRGETVVGDVDGDLVAKSVASLTGNGMWKGDVALRDAQKIEAEEIAGAFSVSDADTATLEDLAGDLIAKQVKSLQVTGRLKGDAVLRGVESALIEEIEGDVSMGDVGTLTLRTLGGDLSAQGVRGALTIDQVNGDVSLRAVAGRVAIEHVGGDFVASGVRDVLQVEEVGGDAVISFDAVAGLTLRAEGDVVINLPEQIDAEIELDAPHGDLVARAGIKIAEEDENHLRGTLGKGGVKIQAESTDGDVIVRQSGAEARSEPVEPYGAPFARMGQQIAAEVRQSVRQSMRDFDLPGRHGNHRLVLKMRKHGHRHEHNSEPNAEPAVEEMRAPVAGSPERKSILDAIARGELNVDDAIRKLTGEE